MECGSHFAFLTAGKDSANINHNKINLVFIDPFYEDLQAALFRSNTVFDSEILTQNDAIISSIVQSTKGKRSDNNYNTYIWTQYPQKIIRSKMLKQGDNQYDSDNEDNESVDSEK